MEPISSKHIQELLVSMSLEQLEFLLTIHRDRVSDQDIAAIIQWAFDQSNITLLATLRRIGILTDYSKCCIGYENHMLLQWIQHMEASESYERKTEITLKHIDCAGPVVPQPDISGIEEAVLRLRESAWQRFRDHVLARVSLRAMLARDFSSWEKRGICGDSYLHCAVDSENVELVRTLVEMGYPIDIPSGEICNSPLIDAINCENLEIVRYLVQGQGALDYANTEGETALIYLSRSWLGEDQIAMLRILLEAGVDVEHKGNRNITALAYLVMHRLKGSRSPWKKRQLDGKSETEIWSDYQRNQSIMIKLMLDYGADPWAKVGPENKPIVEFVLQNDNPGGLEDEIVELFREIQRKGPPAEIDETWKPDTGYSSGCNY